MREAGDRLGWSGSWIDAVLGELPGGDAGLPWREDHRPSSAAIKEFDTALSASAIPPSSRRAYQGRLASLRQLLFETWVVDTSPRRRAPARSLEQRFTEVAMA